MTGEKKAVPVLLVLHLEDVTEEEAHGTANAFVRSVEFDHACQDNDVRPTHVMVGTGPTAELVARILALEEAAQRGVPEPVASEVTPMLVGLGNAPQKAAPAAERTLPCSSCTGGLGPHVRRDTCERCGGDGVEPCAACGKAAHVWVQASPRPGREAEQIALCKSCEEETRGS